MIEKIKNKEEIERKQKRNQIIVGVVLVGLMILSTVGYSFLSNENVVNKEKEKGLDFILQNNLWTLDYSGRMLYFQYLPSQVENVSISGAFNLNTYSGKVLYFTSLDQATIEVIGQLEPYLLRYQEVCLEGKECLNKELPIKNCNDSILITLSNSSQTQVYLDGNCIHLTGETLRAADAFLYKLYGII